MDTFCHTDTHPHGSSSYPLIKDNAVARENGCDSMKLVEGNKTGTVCFYCLYVVWDGGAVMRDPYHRGPHFPLANRGGGEQLSRVISRSTGEVVVVDKYRDDRL